MSAEILPDQNANTFAERPAQRYPTGRPPMSLTGVRGTFGAVLLASFILVLVGGIVATVAGLQAMDIARNTVFSIVSLVLGVVTIFAAVMIWQGRHEIGGIFAIVTGIVFLVLQPETAGIFAVLGGIMAIVANRIADIVT